MQTKFVIDHPKLNKLKSFCGDYIEIFYMKKFVILSSELTDSTIFIDSITISGDDEDFCVRIPSQYLLNLSTESFVEVKILKSVTTLTFNNKNDSFMYDISVNKQLGYSNFKDKIDLLKNLSDYPKVSIAKLRPTINLFMRLNLDINCFNNLVYCEYNRSFIFKKFESPNFCIPAKTMKKISSMADYIVLVDNYVYANLDNSGVHLFTSKVRLKTMASIDHLLNAKYSHFVEVEFKNLISITKKYNLNSNSLIILDLKKQRLTINSDSDQSIIVNIPVTNVTKPSKIVEKKSKEDLLKELKSTEVTAVNLNSKTNPNDFPLVQLPSWVVKCCINCSTSKIYINRNFLVISVSGGKVLIPRVDL